VVGMPGGVGPGPGAVVEAMRWTRRRLWRPNRSRLGRFADGKAAADPGMGQGAEVGGRFGRSVAGSACPVVHPDGAGDRLVRAKAPQRTLRMFADLASSGGSLPSGRPPAL